MQGSFGTRKKFRVNRPDFQQVYIFPVLDLSIQWKSTKIELFRKIKTRIQPGAPERITLPDHHSILEFKENLYHTVQCLFFRILSWNVMYYQFHSSQWSVVNIAHIYGEPYLSTEVTSSIGELSFRSLEQSATQ